jgi:hypothetical protein
LAPLRIAGSPLRAYCTKAPRVYCSWGVLHCDLQQPSFAGRVALVERTQDADRQ